MVEIILAVIGLIGGFLIALGWYRRGLIEMEKELGGIKKRMATIENDYHGLHTDLEVIKQRIGYMEAMLNEIHGVIMRPVKIVQDE